MEKDTQQTILDTARKHFVQHGFAGTRMQEIADEAGINKAMLHYYFRSKQKLYDEVVQDLLNVVAPRIMKAFGAVGSFEERLNHIVSTYIDLLTEHPEVPIFVMAELSQKRDRFVKEIKKRIRNVSPVQSFIVQMMAEMSAGKIKEAPPQQLILTIMGMTIFPFMAKPVFITIFDVPQENFNQIMVERKTYISKFIMDALKP